MDGDLLINALKTLAWPTVIIVAILTLRSAISEAIFRLRGVEGPGGIKIELGALYEVSGKPGKIRDEIWEYVAGILDKVSDETALEMRIEFNKYHSSRMEDVKVRDVKRMLKDLDLYPFFDDEEKHKFTDEITPQYVQAVLAFQEKAEISSDGILGPTTYKKLLTNFEQDDT